MSRGPRFPDRPRVALLVESSNEYGRGLQRGVAAYVRAHGGWSIRLHEMGRGGPLPEGWEGWEGDGILARIENEATAAAVRAKGLPAVDLSAMRLLPELPWVEVDEAEVARLAVDHLRGRGFERLAYCGDGRFRWSDLRGEAFCKEARRRGLAVDRVDVPHGEGRAASLQGWLAEAPRPLGVFACFDRMGHDLLQVCRDGGVMVPEEVAVLGADGDDLLCELADPPLSTVELNAHGAGYLAAELLARRMGGETLAADGHFVAPTGVTQRQSTDVLAIDDPLLARALHLIQRHACDGIGVEDVLRAVPLARRTLETRFRARLGRTPHQEILRVRVERIRRLLLETDLTIAEIARRTGFVHVEYMTVVFKRALGCPPTRYRERAR